MRKIFAYYKNKFFFCRKKSETMKNPFVHFLQLLGIKHTVKYTSRVYNEHPYKNSLYAFSNLLHDYGVDNVAIQLLEEDKDITKLEVPLVVSLGYNLAIVSKIEPDFITYTTLNNYNAKDRLDKFNEYWDGVALLAEIGEKSIEPHYIKHKLYDLFYSLQYYFLFTFMFFLFIYAVWYNELYMNLGHILLLIINFIGVFVGSLLTMKHYKIKSNYADKICSLIQEGNCNDILESDASMLFGLIGLSEVGLSYFTSNCVLLLFFPALIPMLAIINVCVLPFSFWSVWYQKFKANSWCFLCLIVQALFWVIFVEMVFFGYFNQIQESFFFENLIILFCIYAIPFISINLLLSLIIEKNRTESMAHELSSIKANDDVFKTLLIKQPYFEVERDCSQILFGNKDAEILITVFTNPHCIPCARMHNKITKILQDDNSKLCVQYIFSSFREEYDMSTKFLIATYLNNTINDALKIFHEWYSFGRAKRFDFYKKHKVVIDENCMNEFYKHEAWKEKTKLSATPTILVNGYKLPDYYKIEDVLFTTIDFSGL